MTMEMNIEEIGKITVITPETTDLDASNHEDFMKAITPFLELKANNLLDLSTISSMDSSGLGAMAYCLRTARSAGGALALCCPSPSVLGAFDLVHMDRIANIYPSREDAFAAIA